MRSFLPGAPLFVFVLATGAAIAQDLRTPSEDRSEAAAAVRVQPRGRSFVPGSAEDADVQRKIESFNAAQQKLDKMLDEKLTICRRC
ncbi:hypothetical protein JQ628_25335 [Bradyrhizobium lablabi]|uniref:hypothetical protein n=1 Tax=Bradyrhizobium lablabi TaxID=722472 RepID=UPI001BAC50A6|nr:hypothetical protein [Bradyrhizobium lablabi]MBR1124871.1 hypothetical protein [Bradyrhizobium lablabi]